MASASAANSPISPLRLKQIATDACDSTLEKVDSYVHTSSETWNTQIINKILHSIISETSASTQPAYKYAVNSTIIQHLSDPTPRSSVAPIRPSNSSATQTASTGKAENEADGPERSSPVPGGGQDESTSERNDTQASAVPAVKSENSERKIWRRGLHSAIGAYWNNEKDGTWSFKYEGSEDKGMDIVINVIWMSID